MSKDLIILVADKNAQYALRGALQRHQAIGIRPITYDIRTHPGRDGGVRSGGAALLGVVRRQYSHAMMVLDYEGAGSATSTALALEAVLDANGKPHRPKETLELVCRHLQIPRSSSLYEQITSRISLTRCSDSAFLRLKARLREWFPL